MLEVLELMCCVLLCMLEDVEDALFVAGVEGYVLCCWCILKAMEGDLCLPEVLEIISCVLLCIPETEG